ncbi:citrate lyase holo-[acyl-carrier protein] synthase [Enterococcus sp. 669A]|uniref:citrate lyase holo-[acyl-carrier protein] synthase n=1 Tax=Candidatus Enterococcus moelleringii TaxID=2815325 RepID=A0ABS3L6B2_9ENTE|nr:citrate lyase holo-[acyl-carrier protein] synthase [Enterococcus sp. 669A]MBO1305152.1 citrate lyase holo-[acyl-carrier protein] synthase [Enterococcus sp. 669A]
MLSKTSKDLFDGPEITLEEMLESREERAAMQKELLHADTQSTLLCATMNIPGSVKTSMKLEEIFKTITEAIEQELTGISPNANLYWEKNTGLEYYLLLPMKPEELKAKMVQIEETHPYGRLVDLDVLWQEAEEIKSISREALGVAPRRCFICDKNAKECGRARTHSISEMHQAIAQIVEKEEELKNG